MSLSFDRLRAWMIARRPAQAAVTLTQNRIYLLPTRFGLSLLLVAVLVWIGALNYAVSLAYGLAFWIVALLLVSVLMAFRQLIGLRIAFVGVSPVFAGHLAECRLQLQWPDADPRHLKLSPWPGGEDVSCREAGVLVLPVAAPDRGWLPMPVLQVWSDAPLGLIRAFAYVRLSGGGWVYPAPHDDERAWPVQTDAANEGGRRAGQDAGEVDGLAVWQDGMAVNRLVWPVLARRQQLVVRQEGGEQPASGCLHLDWDALPTEMPVETRLSVLCGQLLQAATQGQSVMLGLPGECLTLAPAQLEEGLLRLARYGVQDGR